MTFFLELTSKDKPLNSTVLRLGASKKSCWKPGGRSGVTISVKSEKLQNIYFKTDLEESHLLVRLPPPPILKCLGFRSSFLTFSLPSAFLQCTSDSIIFYLYRKHIVDKHSVLSWGRGRPQILKADLSPGLSVLASASIEAWGRIVFLHRFDAQKSCFVKHYHEFPILKIRKHTITFLKLNLNLVQNFWKIRNFSKWGRPQPRLFQKTTVNIIHVNLLTSLSV